MELDVKALDIVSMFASGQEFPDEKNLICNVCQMSPCQCDHNVEVTQECQKRNFIKCQSCKVDFDKVEEFYAHMIDRCKKGDELSVTNITKSCFINGDESSTSKTKHQHDYGQLITCRLCGAKFSEHTDYEMHWLIKHQSVTNKTPYYCKECEHHFPSKSTYSAHNVKERLKKRKYIHPNEATVRRISDIVDAVVAAGRPSPCSYDYCGKKFPSKECYVIHTEDDKCQLRTSAMQMQPSEQSMTLLPIVPHVSETQNFNVYPLVFTNNELAPAVDESQHQYQDSFENASDKTLSPCDVDCSNTMVNKPKKCQKSNKQMVPEIINTFSLDNGRNLFDAFESISSSAGGIGPATATFSPVGLEQPLNLIGYNELVVEQVPERSSSPEIIEVVPRSDVKTFGNRLFSNATSENPLPSNQLKTRPKEKFFTCRICSRQLASNRSYKQHFQNLHKDYSVEEMFDDGWKCTLCSSVHNTVNGLQAHWISCHKELYNKNMFAMFAKNVERD